MNDADVEARIKNGKLILSGPDGKVRYTLSPNDRSKKLEAGPYEIRVEGADGLVLDTPEFTLKKGGEVTVRVTMGQPAVVKNTPASLAADRTAAEYVLSIGGTVRVNDEERDIKGRCRSAGRTVPADARQFAWQPEGERHGVGLLQRV